MVTFLLLSAHVVAELSWPPKMPQLTLTWFYQVQKRSTDSKPPSYFMENKGRNHLLTVHVLMPLLGTGQFYVGLLHGPKAARLDVTLRPSLLSTDRSLQSRSHPSTSSFHSLSNEGNWFLSKVSEDPYLGLTSLPAPRKKKPKRDFEKQKFKPTQKLWGHLWWDLLWKRHSQSHSCSSSDEPCPRSPCWQLSPSWAASQLLFHFMTEWGWEGWQLCFRYKIALYKKSEISIHYTLPQVFTNNITNAQ